MKSKPVKKDPIKAPSSRLPDEDEHQKLLDKARSEKDRMEIQRMREVISATRQKPMR